MKTCVKNKDIHKEIEEFFKNRPPVFDITTTEIQRMTLDVVSKVFKDYTGEEYKQGNWNVQIFNVEGQSYSMLKINGTIVGQISLIFEGEPFSQIKMEFKPV
jgi:hypothetical protein